MLVPLELDILAKKRGFLSPELALGWRIGSYVTEYFDDLEDVRIATREDGDAALGLSMMCRKNQFPFPVTIASEHRPWDFLVYHYPTGTLMQFTAAPDWVELPHEYKHIERRLQDEDTNIADNAAKYYRHGLDELIVRILNKPVDTYCRVVESRVRFLDMQGANSEGQLRCRRCGKLYSREEMLDNNGIICCLFCAGLESSWFEWT